MPAAIEKTMQTVIASRAAFTAAKNATALIAVFSINFSSQQPLPSPLRIRHGHPRRDSRAYRCCCFGISKPANRSSRWLHAQLFSPVLLAVITCDQFNCPCRATQSPNGILECCIVASVSLGRSISILYLNLSSEVVLWLLEYIISYLKQLNKHCIYRRSVFPMDRLPVNKCFGFLT